MAATLKDRMREIVGPAPAPLSVSEAAEVAQVSSSAVSQWLSGKTKSIKSGPALRLAARTGYSATWIATGIGPKMDTRGNPDVEALINEGPQGRAQVIDMLRVAVIKKRAEYGMADTERLLNAIDEVERSLPR